MPLVFKTEKDSPDNVDIAGVGRLGAHAKGGRNIEDAARIMVELQDEDGNALEGDELRDAADEWAERIGVQVVEVTDEEFERLPEELGALPEPTPADQVATIGYQRLHPEELGEPIEGWGKLASVPDDVAEPAGLSKKELLERAKELDIPGASGMNKDDLEAAVQEAEAEQGEAPSPLAGEAGPPESETTTGGEG